ncbi:thiol reductant ABC exporter, CydC subunit [Micromonospora citrea]|uniref:Thiol reductant ABC exporter, CydC subunit n=1 Tax=Micromonospora citrea TaxID=47855 RepID=A0A1C6VYF5_9ACTN|nr:thiol reductant ABC exporter subunit CydC [Micromonospora citrea]SCL71237.1 thiol reductant ABC exporter, CydC subunit [Micromonospora citrea]
MVATDRASDALPTAPPSAGAAGSPPGGPRPGALRRLLPAVTGHSDAFRATLAANLVGQLATVGAAALGAWLVGRAVTGGPTPVGTAAAALGGLVAVIAAVTWWEMLVSHDLAYRVLADLRLRVYDAITRLVPGRLAGRRSGDLATVALSDVETLEWLFAHTIAQLITAAVVLAAGTALAASVDPWLPAVVLPLAGLVAVAPWLLRRAADRHGARIRDTTAGLAADVVDTVQGLRELTVFGALERRRADLAARTRQLGRAQRANAARAGLETALVDTLLAVAGVAALLVVVDGVRRARVDPALGPVAVVLAGTVLGPAAQVALLLKQAGTLRAAAGRIDALLGAPAAVTAPTRPVPAPTGGGEVVFDDVHFGYLPGRPVLRGVSLTVRPGETVALVGASGVGKSTCAHLLLRFADPTAGRITVGGVDLRDLADAELRRTVTVVPQDVHLFPGSIADNIRLGRPDATDADVRLAADAAQVSAFASGLPDGLDTPVGERGATLSGGQRARVAVARALLTGAPVLVLDEAVANLDARTERDLSRALAATGSGRATLVIAHRLSTIVRADRVVVLDSGRVVADGSFDSLREREPLAGLLADQPARHRQGPPRR